MVQNALVIRLFLSVLLLRYLGLVCSINLYMHVTFFFFWFYVCFSSSKITTFCLVGAGTPSFCSYRVWKNTGILYSSLNTPETTYEQRIQSSDHSAYPRTC